jgi:hypothetical protein
MRAVEDRAKSLRAAMAEFDEQVTLKRVRLFTRRRYDWSDR